LQTSDEKEDGEEKRGVSGRSDLVNDRNSLLEEDLAVHVGGRKKLWPSRRTGSEGELFQRICSVDQR